VPDDAPEGTVGKRKFSPFLTRASFGFQLNSDSWIARMLRLSPRADEEAEDSVPGQPADSLDVPAAEQAAQGDITDWQTGPDERLIGSGGVREQRSRRDDRVGSWSANFDYVLSRRRPRPGTDRDPGDSQTLRGSFRMQPTRFWALSWATGYDFTDSEFSDHVLTLTRTMHDFDANFDFLKAQNGNFTFQFRVQLRANPDLKVDYTQRDLNRTPGLR